MTFQPKYATNAVYGGQRLSVGRTVIMRVGPAIVAGLVQEIARNGDPTVYTPGATAPQGLLGFYDAKSEADLSGMPDLHWTWPPRVEVPRTGPAIQYTGNTA